MTPSDTVIHEADVERKRKRKARIEAAALAIATGVYARSDTDSFAKHIVGEAIALIDEIDEACK